MNKRIPENKGYNKPFGFGRGFNNDGSEMTADQLRRQDAEDLRRRKEIIAEADKKAGYKPDYFGDVVVWRLDKEGSKTQIGRVQGAFIFNGDNEPEKKVFTTYTAALDYLTNEVSFSPDEAREHLDAMRPYQKEKVAAKSWEGQFLGGIVLGPNDPDPTCLVPVQSRPLGVDGDTHALDIAWKKVRAFGDSISPEERVSLLMELAGISEQQATEIAKEFLS